MKRYLAILSFCLLAGASFLIQGCIPNHFEDYYQSYDATLFQHFGSIPEEHITLRPVYTEDNVIDCLEDGYLTLGISTFTDTHCPWVKAIDHAETVGATLVLIDEQYKTTKRETSVIFLPMTQYSYTSGTIYNSYGGTSRYSGTVQTTTMQPISYDYEVPVYEQTAMFLKKGDFRDYYGVLLYTPKLLPGETPDRECRTTILAVLKGSQAERDGLKRGQRVVKINDTAIQTYRDIQTFTQNPKSIRSVEVQP